MNLKDFLLRQPALYRLWQMPFAARKVAPMVQTGLLAEGRRVLDIGCGPGTSRSLFSGAKYLGVDISTSYVRSGKERHGGWFVAGDATTLPIRGSGFFDLVLVNSLLHHLPNEQVGSVMVGIDAVLSPAGSVHVIDLINPSGPSVARTLAGWDRGDYPRTEAEWVTLLGEYFKLEHVETYPIGIGPLHMWYLIYLRGRRKP